jgi:DNA-binding CsgD family transcriptional regulator
VLCGRQSANRGPEIVTVDEFSRLVSSIYAAALTPRHWEQAIRQVQCAMGGTGGSLLVADGAIWSVQASTIPERADKSYAEHYCRLDPVLVSVGNGPVGAVRTGTELIAPNRKSEFYVGWMRPNELEDGLFAKLTDGPRPTCFLVTSASHSKAFDTPERVKLMSGLVPHLQEALRTQNKLAALTHDSVDLPAAREMVRHGVLIVERGCLVVNLNSAAEGILRAEDGVHIRSGCIGATSTNAERRLHHAIHAALTDEGSNIRSARSLSCERPSGKRPYVIHVLPLHQGGIGEASTDARTLVVIIDPEREHESAAALLRRLHGLTNAEAQVAIRLMRGANLKQISDELSVSLTTVRTHLQHVFDKTDTHRQAELVRHLLTLQEISTNST